MARWLALVLAALWLTGCGKTQQATPALWQVSGPGGQGAYLFGTIHALPDGVEWHSLAIDKALAGSDVLVVEIAAMEPADLFGKLATTKGLPPLSLRVDPDRRNALAHLLKTSGLKDNGFQDVETWAAALTLSRGASEGESRNGVDRALLDAPQGKRPATVLELEGLAAQLRMFDTLPEAEQRDLLESVIDEAGLARNSEQTLVDAWIAGDTAALARESARGILADVELRTVLFTSRNRAWAERVADLTEQGQRPFVAVGAAHMAGPEGLPALLAARGYTVSRIQ